MMVPTYLPVLNQEDEEVQENIRRFEELCHQSGIACRSHKDYSALPNTEIVKETRFADVLIISSETFYQTFAGNDLNPNLRDVLHGAECPVIVVPEHFQFPIRNILFYDGSASSVYAIKQFAYLFPELGSNETLLVYSNADAAETVPYETNIEELAQQHFKNLHVTRLHLDAKKEISGWIESQQSAMLVGGAFGRSGLSEVFRKSFMHDVITLHKFPVFIAHK